MLNRKPGVYKIICTVNKKIYIGSSMCLKYRIVRHFNELYKQIHPSKHLQNAYNKYGETAFRVEIIEEFEKECISKKELLAVEQKYLDQLKPWDRKIGYNSCKIAGSPAKEKITEEHKQKIREHLIGRPVSEETREKLRKSHMGKKMSDESVEKMRKKKIGIKQSEESIEKRAKEYAFIGPDGKIYKGKNLKRFAEEHNLHRFNLNKVLSGERKSHHGFRKL